MDFLIKKEGNRMTDKIDHSAEKSNRRRVIKKAVMFVIPTMFTFQVAALHAQPSGNLDLPKGNPVP
jgi:hypothetical protein